MEKKIKITILGEKKKQTGKACDLGEHGRRNPQPVLVSWERNHHHVAELGPAC